MEYPTIKKLFDFIFFDTVADDWRRRWWVAFLAFSDRVIIIGA